MYVRPGVFCLTDHVIVLLNFWFEMHPLVPRSIHCQRLRPKQWKNTLLRLSGKVQLVGLHPLLLLVPFSLKRRMTDSDSALTTDGQCGHSDASAPNTVCKICLYNMVYVWAGDEWKTASCRYLYKFMPSELANS